MCAQSFGWLTFIETAHPYHGVPMERTTQKGGNLNLPQTWLRFERCLGRTCSGPEGSCLPTGRPFNENRSPEADDVEQQEPSFL